VPGVACPEGVTGVRAGINTADDFDVDTAAGRSQGGGELLTGDA
jgi:hypothetical protein